MDVGQEWAFRLRDSAPSERVRVIAIREGKRTSRVDVEFLDRPDAPPGHDLPATRLRVRWSKVTAFDEQMAAWERLADEDITEAEAGALDLPFQLIPSDVATQEWKPVRYATAVHDPHRFSRLTGLDLASMAESIATYEHEGVTYLSPPAPVPPRRVAPRARSGEAPAAARYAHAGRIRRAISMLLMSPQWPPHGR